MGDHEHEHERDAGSSVRSRIASLAWRLGGPWLAVTGVIATSSTCPYCGNPACAVGIGQAAGIGAVTSGVLWAINRFRGRRERDVGAAEPATVGASEEGRSSRR